MTLLPWVRTLWEPLTYIRDSANLLKIWIEVDVLVIPAPNVRYLWDQTPGLPYIASIHFYHCLTNCHRFSGLNHICNSLAALPQTVSIEFPHNPAVPVLLIHSESKTGAQTNTHTHIFVMPLFTIAKRWE